MPTRRSLCPSRPCPRTGRCISGICNTIRADSGQVESNKIGLRTAEKILTQMGGSFRRHEAEGKFTAEAILPIVPEDADE